MLYLAITKYGYYLGLSEASARRNGKQIPGGASLYSCYSLRDAEEMIRGFRKIEHIHAYEIIVGKIVLFRPVLIKIFYSNNLQECRSISDKGEVVIRRDNKVVWKVRVNPLTLQPDRKGLSLLQKEGKIPYYDFEAEKKVWIVEMNGKFKAVSEENLNSEDRKKNVD